MSRMKSLFAIAVLVAVAGTVQQANAVSNTATIKIMLAGSSAIWQEMALGTYGFNGTNAAICPPGAVKPCFHYTSNTFSLTDNRPHQFANQPAAVDANNGIWVVWDSHVTTTASSGTFSMPNVWAYIKVDTAVGDRCYFANPRCVASTGANGWVAPNQQINAALWGNDTDPNGGPNGAPVVAAFQAGVVIGGAASDIRPEDALWATCRVNSALSTTTLGLGYNSAITAGQCPTTATAKTSLAGTDIVSKVNTGHTAHAVAWNISGKDPYSGNAIPAFKVASIGAAPIIFVGSLGGGGSLSTVNNVTDSGLQAVFSGANCDASALGAGTSDPLQVFLREPLSGTMNTAEYTVFAYPDFSGASQETGVGTPTGTSNPLNQACPGGPAGGNRIRGVGTGDVMTGVWDTGTGSGGFSLSDSITYTFFSYGNVTNGTKSLNDSATFKYFTLNGVDPIFHRYQTSTADPVDPGQPNAFPGEIPGPGDFAGIQVTGPTRTCAATCPENGIWHGGLSFPNVRNGQYRAWSIVRLVSDGTNFTTAQGLVTLSNEYAAGYIPDYAPVAPVAAHTTGAIINPADPGLSLLRSHYQEQDTNGVSLGGAPVDDSTTGDVGGDVGGCIEHAVPGVTAAAVAESDSTKNQTQTTPGSQCAVFSGH